MADSNIINATDRDIPPSDILLSILTVISGGGISPPSYRRLEAISDF